MFDSMIQAFMLYVSLLILIGVYFYYKNLSSKTKSSDSKKLNYWITAISAQASDMSDWLFMGFPGIIYLNGLVEIWTAVGLVFFMFLNWYCIAPRFKIASESTKSSTLASFLQKKFHGKNNAIRLVSGLLCLYFFVFYIAAGFAGLGRVFQSAFGINYYQGMAIGLIISLAYTILGGLVAVAWSNLIQGIFLLITIIFVPLYAINNMGGIQSLITTLHLQGPHYLSAIPQHNAIMTTTFTIMAWGLGYFGQPHILVNFMNIDSVKNMRKAMVVGISWQIIVLSAAVLIGIVGKAYIPSLDNPELIFITMVTSMFTPFVAGIILCAILAATISTINTQSLVCASLITNDLYYPFTQSKSSLFRYAAIGIIPVLAFITACYNQYNIFQLVFYAWSGLGCSFGPLVILSLYSTIVTPLGGLAGLVAGGCIGIFWPLQHAIPTLIAGSFVNSIVTIFISLITRKKYAKK